MAHDKDAIRRAKQKRIFDDSFDPLALTISGREKRNIVSSLESAKKDLQDSIREKEKGGKESQLTVSEVKAAKNEPSEGLWERLVRFVVRLFTGMGVDEYVERKKLKLLRRQMKRIRPPLYNFKKDMVSSSIAHQVFLLFELLMPYKSVFNQILSQKSEERPLTFQLLFLKSASANPHLDKVKNFSGENLTNAIASYDRDVVRDKVQEMLKSYFATFVQEDRKAINRTFVEMMRINELYDFDFIAFLERFNRDFSMHRQRKPAFNDAPPHGLVPLLKDLQSMLLMIDFNFLHFVFEAARNFFEQEILPKEQTEEKRAFQSLMQRMSASGYRPLVNAIATLLKEDRLSLLIRYISHDFNYAPKQRARHQETNFFKDFAKTLVADVNARLAEFYKQRAQESLGKKLFALCKVKELPSLYVYSEEKNDILKKMELPVFLYPKALNFLVVFFREVYFARMRKFLNKLIAEGHFADNQLMKELSDEVYRMNDIYNDLNEFITHVDENCDKGQLLLTMINRYKGEAATRNAMVARIKSLNKELSITLNMLRSTMRHLHELLGKKEVRTSLSHGDASKGLKTAPHFEALDRDFSLFFSLFQELYPATGQGG